MKPDDLRSWLSTMGFTNYRAAQELDVSASTVANWLDGSTKISRVVALACAALSAKLSPYGSDDPAQ